LLDLQQNEVEAPQQEVTENEGAPGPAFQGNHFAELPEDDQIDMPQAPL
jgi:hypothetical protein